MLEFILISLLFSNILKSKIINRILLASVFIFEIFSVFNYVTSAKNLFDFLPLVIESFFFTTIILYFFYNTMRYNFKTPLYALPNFWISVGFLIYFSGNFFLFLFSKIIEPSETFRQQYIIIYSLMTIIKNLLLCTAILVNNTLFNKKKNTLISSSLEFDKLQTL